MKATGIVRRIDDLGRVVIPKEIRRTQRIRVGDPLEIYVSAEGDVIFRKYSPLAELSMFAASYAEVLFKTAGMSIAIADRDEVIAASGAAKETLGKRSSAACTRIAEQRRLTVYDRNADVAAPTICESLPLKAEAVVSILCHGDLIGAVLLCADGKQTDAHNTALLAVAAAFLGKQMEE
ncbi:MAG: stage V sporulation T C-terminal domain-containing protein [Ruthenibacterium sp.]